MGQQHRLDLGGGDVIARPADDVLLARFGKLKASCSINPDRPPGIDSKPLIV
jgi:hypothetical protein